MGKNTTNDMTQGNCMRLLVRFFCRSWQGICFSSYTALQTLWWWERNWRYGTCSGWNTGSVHFLIIGFAIGLTGGLGICISPVFWKWQLRKTS